MNPLPPDPYKILGIPSDAQLGDIRAAHRKLVKVCHPDKVAADASDDERKTKEDEFKRVQKAYELLSDENERRKYDDKVKMHKRFMEIRRAAAGANAFTSGVSHHWEGPGGVRVNLRTEPNIRTAEPRPDTFSSRSPPRDAPEQYHQAAKATPQQARPDRVKPNIGLKHTTDARPRRSPSYESHPSPTDEVSDAARQRAAEEKKEAAARKEREREAKRAEKAMKAEKAEKTEKTEKAEKRSSEKRNKDEKSSRRTKDKEPYVESPQQGSEEVYVSKSAKKASSKHKHRSSKHDHDRSRSRSASRSRDKPKKKEAAGKTRLFGEVEEPDDSETGADSGTDDLLRKMKSAEQYLGRAPAPPLKHSNTYSAGDFGPMPSAPTPPPQVSGLKPPPPPETRLPPNIVNADPHLRIHRTATAPHTAAYRNIPVPAATAEQYVYGGSPNTGRQRSRLAQHYYPEDEDIVVDDPRGSRSRRGSANTYSPAQHGFPRQGSYPPLAEEFSGYQPATGYFPPGASGHSPKHHVASGFRHVAGTSGGGGGGAPFRHVHTGPAYEPGDVTYSSIPHQHGYPSAAYS